MNGSLESGASSRNPRWSLAALLLWGAWPVLGQTFEVTPLIGGIFGGTLKVQQEGQDAVLRAHFRDGLSAGIAAGFRFTDADALDYCDQCAVIEFRWLRQRPEVGLQQLPPTVNPLGAPAPVANVKVTLDHFLGDFTHEWIFNAGPTTVRPFVTASLGATRMSAPAGAATRFAFGIGTGVKVFSHKRWGVRAQLEYLPTVMHAEVQTLVCVSGCIVALNGGLLNQFSMSIGPVFRF
jgi:hypothetical protein